MTLSRDRAERRFVLSAPVGNHRDLSKLKQRLGLTTTGFPLLFERLFGNQHLKDLKKGLESARSRDPRLGFDVDRFESYVLIGCGTADAAAVRGKLLASGLSWYSEASSVPTGVCSLNRASLSQGHLGPAPFGIDAEHAGKLEGGKGQGIQFADIENGWDLNNPELVKAQPAIALHGYNSEVPKYRHHGTAVLGIVLAADDKIGALGVAPAAKKVDVFGIQNRPNASFELAAALASALSLLDPGDVLLIEQHTSSGATMNRPVEVEPAISDLLRLATALGIVVVEPAGNGFHDLSDPGVVDPAMGTTLPLDPKALGFRDSGAIMVGGLDPATFSRSGMKRSPDSNWGCRVDCCAWAKSIETIGFYGLLRAYGVKWALRQAFSSGIHRALYSKYCHFSGTSGAAALVAGAVLSIQGVHLAGHRRRLRPREMRSLLRDPSHGTPPAPGAEVGVMPDLKKITDTILAGRMRP